MIPVSVEVHEGYAKEMEEKLRHAGIRAELDVRNEKLGYKIREAQMKKTPYILVIGDKEIENEAVNVRRYGEEKSEVVSLSAFIESVQDEIYKKCSR